MIDTPASQPESQAARAYNEVFVEFTHGSTQLSGTLYLPHGAGLHPAVVYVFGSGPAGRDGFGSIPPIARTFASQGIASFAWDKPGIGQSSGDWRQQTLRDRASEAMAAIQYLKQRPNIATDRIGVWGISQAGWVIPLMFELPQVEDIRFAIMVSVPVATGVEQELYRVTHRLPADGFTQEETEQAVDFTRRRLALVQNHAPYSEVEQLQQAAEDEPWFEAIGHYDQAFFEFAQRDPFASPQPSIIKMQCPVLAIFGDRDNIVDFRESSAVYQRLLAQADNRDVTVQIFRDADHMLFKTERGSEAEMTHSFSGAAEAYALGYLDLMAEWTKARVF